MWALKGICICWVLSGVFPRESEEGVCLCWFLKCMCSECCVCLCVFGVLSAVCVCVCAGSEGCGRSSGLWRRVCVLGSVGCLVCDGFEGCRVPVLNLMIVYQLNSEGSLLIKGTNIPKILILPVPLQIVNATHDFAGEIKAPEKFRRYLIDCLAVSLAIIYGVSSLPAMEKQQAVSYNLLKKNKPQPLHEANVSERVQDKLRTDRRLYGRFGF